jgi:hypothetical protein
MMETKRFRKVYWVTEQLDAEGKSSVAGVFTSVHDLVENGLTGVEGSAKNAGFRLTLVELDKVGPLGTWESPDYTGLSDDLEIYVRTGEVAVYEKDDLVAQLKETPVPT